MPLRCRRRNAAYAIFFAAAFSPVLPTPPMRYFSGFYAMLSLILISRRRFDILRYFTLARRYKRCWHELLRHSDIFAML